MNAWLPIETAPKDETTIDLLCLRPWSPPQRWERSVDMYWCLVHHCWRQRGHEHYVDSAWKPHARDRHLVPTHWMPIPDLPAVYADTVQHSADEAGSMP